MVEDNILLEGIVEMDETYVGGKPRKGSNRKNGEPNKRGRGTKKTPVIGMIERGPGGRVVAEMTPTCSQRRLNSMIKRCSDHKNIRLMTDEFGGYYSAFQLVKRHDVICHSDNYVRGDVHTNSIESFWAIVKRGIMGQYHKVTDRYLQSYLNEYCYRFNNRENPDVFGLTISLALGTR